MSNNTEVIFEDIEQRIITEIENAHYAIFVSVAWFTNKKLFNALLEKARDNCYVSIIIQLDEINSQSGINYSEIQIGRSECFKISKDTELLHDKFCVIDFKKVITGSYNWTYKASHNSENILILNDPNIASQYISRFEQQKAKFKDSKIQQHSQIQNSSSTIVSYQKVVTPSVQHITQPNAQPTTKQCPHCKTELRYIDKYCKHCGRIQDGYEGLTILVTCRECSKIQNGAFIDIINSNYCTYCGSNNLEWDDGLLRNNLEWDDGLLPF